MNNLGIYKRAGRRLQVIREITGQTREQFAEWLELDIVRLRNVEQLKAKASEVEFEKIGERLPQFLLFFACGGPISFDELRKSDCPIVRAALARLEARLIKIDLMGSLRKYLK